MRSPTHPFTCRRCFYSSEKEKEFVLENGWTVLCEKCFIPSIPEKLSPPWHFIPQEEIPLTGISPKVHEHSYRIMALEEELKFFKKYIYELLENLNAKT